MKPEFSIIMPVYNAEQFVVEAITSVLKQTFTNWELLICDDASTDKSLNIIKPFLLDNRIKLYKNKHNIGNGATLYKLAKKVSSDYFGQLDADDLLTPNAIQMMYDSHKHYPKAGLIYSQFMYCDDKMKPLKLGYCNHIPKNKTNLEANKVSHFKTFKVKYYKLTSGYHQTIRTTTDKDISYKMEEVADLVFVNKVLYLYRKHSDGISQGENRKSCKASHKQVKEEARERRRKK